jgi:hypothetical protein
VFEGLDAVPWGELRQAYGTAGEVPEHLRSIGSGDPAKALGALDKGLWHQGTVYPATAAAVPYLAELTAVPDAAVRAGLLDLLRRIGTGRAADDEVTARCRAGVLAGSDAYLAGLDDPDRAVRAYAAYLLGDLHERAGALTPAMLDRLAVEEDPTVRASLILALGELASRAQPHLPAVPAALTPLLDAAAPDERAAAAVALRWQRDRVAQPEGVMPVLFDSLGRDLPVLDDLPVVDDDTFGFISAALGTDLGESLPYLVEALRSPSWQTRDSAVSRGSELMATWRHAPPVVVPVLLPVLADRTARVRAHAADVLNHNSGASLALAADALAGVLADVVTRVDLDRVTARPARHPKEPDERLVAASVEGLAAAGDARAVEPAGRLLRSNAVALDWRVALEGLRGHAAVVLPAVRDVLRARTNRTGLFDGVAAWGHDAAPVVPELLALVRNGSAEAMRTLLALTTPERPYAGQVVAALTERLTPDAPGSWRVFAADHHRLTGDPVPALAALLPGLREDGPFLFAAEELGRLGPPAEPALPWVRRLLSDEKAEHRWYGAVAWWRITGDVQPLLPLVMATLDEYRILPRHVSLLAEIGPAARDALPFLREVRDRDRRYAIGGFVTTVRQDEALRALAATAVQRIEAG